MDKYNIVSHVSITAVILLLMDSILVTKFDYPDFYIFINDVYYVSELNLIYYSCHILNYNPPYSEVQVLIASDVVGGWEVVPEVVLSNHSTEYYSNVGRLHKVP